MRAEIQAALDDGTLVEAFARRPSEARTFLFELALARGDLERAEELIAGGVLHRSMAAPYVARIHLERGETGRACELYLLGLEGDLGDEEALGALMDLAPERALRVFEAANPDGDLEWWDTDEAHNLARLLHRLGRGAEAVPLLTAQIEGLGLRPDGLALLAELAPAETEVLLRENLDQPGPCGNPAAFARGQLLDFLELTGQSEVLVAALFAELDSGRDWNSGDRHRRLARLAPRAWSERLEQALLEDPRDGGLWAQLGDCQAELGDESGAVESWLRAYHLDEEGGWLERAAALAPQRVLPALEAAIDEENSGDWGWYGDVCWRAGDRSNARYAWRRAQELDPTDDGWFDRLERCAGGYEPLDEQASSALTWAASAVFD